MKLAIYDFDGTYVSVQTVPHVFKLWKQLKYDMKVYKMHWKTIKRWYILHKLKIGWNKETFRKNAMAKTIDLLHHLDDVQLKHFMHQLYESLKPHINKDMKEQLQKDKQDGYFTILLSGSFDIMIEPFLNEGFDEVIGTKSKNNMGRLNSKTVQIMIKDQKLKAMVDRFHGDMIEYSKAYADSYYDLPLLKYVDDGQCYHPDQALRSSCQINQLNIID